MSQRTIQESIAALATEGRDELLRLWLDVFNSPAPQSLSIPLLQRGISYKLQADASGGLSRRARETLRHAAASVGTPPSRKPRPGAKLLREWNGIAHVVDVVDIVESIVDGRQPTGLTVTKLRLCELPLVWSEQRALLGVESGSPDAGSAPLFGSRETSARKARL